MKIYTLPAALLAVVFLIGCSAHRHRVQVITTLHANPNGWTRARPVPPAPAATEAAPPSEEKPSAWHHFDESQETPPQRDAQTIAPAEPVEPEPAPPPPTLPEQTAPSPVAPAPVIAAPVEPTPERHIDTQEKQPDKLSRTLLALAPVSLIGLWLISSALKGRKSV